MNPETSSEKVRLLITLGDVAGIGPEIVVKAWPKLVEFCHPTVIGSVEWLERAAMSSGSRVEIVPVLHPNASEPTARRIPCLNPSGQDLSDVKAGKITAEGGRAAYDFLCDAIDRVMFGQADAIVTAPLHKEGLHLAGIKHPGHTEILAERTGTTEFAMVLWGDGIAVAHVTLHMALRKIFDHLTIDAVLEKIRLLHSLLPKLVDRPHRIGVAALNPHGGDGGLFGDEEATIIAPAIEKAKAEGIPVSGPWPADTLFVRASKGEFDGIVAMYHDEGHIAMKLRSGPRAVNISAGLPLVRTSVAHGTAYDIAGKGLADEGSLLEAAHCAVRLCRPE